MEIAIKPLDVTIKTININGKKMTKSILNQIVKGSCLNLKCEFTGDDLFGYVIDKDKYLIWAKSGRLFKTKLLEVNSILSKERNDLFNERLEDIYATFYAGKDIFIPTYEQEREYEEFQKETNRKIKEQYLTFLKSIENSQIYI